MKQTGNPARRNMQLLAAVLLALPGLASANADLKAKIEYSKTNREKLLDEQVQRVLAGEKPQRPAAFDQFPHAKGGMPPPPPMEDDELPPLDDEDAPPPPPAE